MTNAVRHHCAWSSCSRLYTPDRPGHTYCGHQDCPATKVVPEHGPRPTCLGCSEPFEADEPICYDGTPDSRYHKFCADDAGIVRCYDRPA